MSTWAKASIVLVVVSLLLAGSPGRARSEETGAAESECSFVLTPKGALDGYARAASIDRVLAELSKVAGIEFFGVPRSSLQRISFKLDDVSVVEAVRRILVGRSYTVRLRTDGPRAVISQVRIIDAAGDTRTIAVTPGEWQPYPTPSLLTPDNETNPIGNEPDPALAPRYLGDLSQEALYELATNDPDADVRARATAMLRLDAPLDPAIAQLPAADAPEPPKQAASARSSQPH